MSLPRLSPPQPWVPMTDAQWLALLPFVLPRSPQGRRVSDLRRRMDGIFWIAASRGAPWRDLPERFGKPDTVARFFRRLTHGGLWQRLLRELALTDSPAHPLRQIEHAVCRATRRAARLGGLHLLVLIRRLGLRSALNGPPWLLPDPDLSETLRRFPLPAVPTTRKAADAALATVRSVAALLRHAAGRRSMPRSVRWGWP